MSQEAWKEEVAGYIDPVAFSDAENNSCRLGKIFKKPAAAVGDQTPHLLWIFAGELFDNRIEKKQVGGDKNFQPGI